MTEPDYKNIYNKVAAEISQYLKQALECEQRRRLFEEWGEKLELEKDATIGEFMEKLKLYQNLHPDEE